MDNLTKAKINLKELLTTFKDSISFIGRHVFDSLVISISVIFLTFIIYFIPVLINGEYESILRIAEFAIIGSGTLAILTFTYAIAIGNVENATAIGNEESETKKKIVHSGELLFKSTISFIIGLGLLPAVGLMFKNYPKYSNFYGIFNGIVAEIYNETSTGVTIFILTVGVCSLMLSAYLFTVGIIELIKVLRPIH